MSGYAVKSGNEAILTCSSSRPLHKDHPLYGTQPSDDGIVSREFGGCEPIENFLMTLSLERSCRAPSCQSLGELPGHTSIHTFDINSTHDCLSSTTLRSNFGKSSMYSQSPTEAQRAQHNSV